MINRQHRLFLPLFLLFYTAALIWLERGLPFDRALADMFFTRPCDAAQHTACWLFDKQDPRLTLILHEIPRLLFIAIAVICGLVFLAGYKWPKLSPYRIPAAAACFGIGVTAGIVAVLKHATGHLCPNELAYFSGPYATAADSPTRQACFPASHPAASFGLLAVYFSPSPLLYRRAALYISLTIGTLLSLIQLARGEHFISHSIGTFLTALLAAFIFEKLSDKYLRA